MRATLLVLLALVGCEFAPPTLERPSLEPQTSGATMYVLEARDDLLDQGVNSLVSFDPASPVRLLGKRDLRDLLKSVSLGKSATLVSARHFDLNQWEENELPPDRPVHYLEREADGRFSLRELANRAGFALKVRAARIEDGKVVHLEYAVSLFWPEHRKLPGTSLEAGKPSIRELPIDAAAPKVPIGGALWIPCPRDGDRVYLVILHIASVTPA